MAAGKPIGTMYAEIDLDRTKYDKALQDVLASSETGAVKVEKAWKNLGIKTDEVYGKMKANAVLSYEAIAKSGIASADEIRRAEEAKNEKLRRLNEQQFGHQTTIIESLKKNWIAAAAVIGTAMVAAGKAWDMAKVGADYEEQRGILDNLARKYSATSESIVADMERASDGLVARADLMQIALGGIAKGLKPEQLTNLADAARILGDSVGKDATTALNDLTQALETGKTKALKGYLGTTIDLEAAFGDLYTKMTETEKANALYSITMIEATKLQSQQTGAVDDAGDKIERLEAKYKNLTTTMSIWAKTAVVWLFDMEGWTRGALAMSGIEMPEASATSPVAAKNDADSVVAGYQRQIDSLKKLLQARKDIKKSEKDAPKEAAAWAKDYIAAYEKEAKAAEDFYSSVAKEQEKMANDIYLKEMELFEETEKANAKYLDDMKKDAEKANDSRLKSYRSMFKDLKGYEADYYNVASKAIDEQAAEFLKATKDSVTVEAWAANERKKLWIEYAKKSTSAIDGVKAYMIEMYDNMMTKGRAAYEMTASLFTSLKSTLGNVFFDAMKGELNSFSDYWKSFTDSLLKAFANVVAQMVVEWTTAQFAMSRLGASMGMTNGMLSGYAGGMMASGGGASPLGAVGAGYAAYSLGSGAAGSGAMTLNGVVYGSAEEMFAAAGTSSWMAEASAALPWIGGALLADQLLFGGQGTNAVINGVSNIVSGAADAVSSVVSSIGSVFGFSSGGRVGESTGSLYNLPAFAFANAPHAATGLRLPDGGIPIVAHPGERVLNPQETRAYEGGGNLKIGTLQIFLDGQEVRGLIKVIADGVVVERNRRGVDLTRRVYS